MTVVSKQCSQDPFTPTVIIIVILIIIIIIMRILNRCLSVHVASVMEGAVVPIAGSTLGMRLTAECG